MQVRVVDVVAFALVSGVAAAGPIFLNHAIAQDQLDLAITGRARTVRGHDLPFADPEIELAVGGVVSTWFQIVIGLLDNFREARVSAECRQFLVAIQSPGVVESILRGFLQIFEGVFRVVLRRVSQADSVFSGTRSGSTSL